METYVALLRGINVGGKTLKMEPLRGAFEKAGFFDVRTYVQSGNVVFATKTSSNRLSEAMEKRILADFGLSIRILVKSLKELNEITKRNPFLKDKAIDQSKLHVTFLSAIPTIPGAAAARELEALATNGERFHILDQQIYLYCPGGYGKTKLSNNAIEKKLQVVATTRNWRTVNALLALMRSNP
jgi:uncharacterized protein (DUF1697 family)